MEIKVEQKLPDFIYFINEYEVEVSVPIMYEWHPIKCSHCSEFGHDIKDCKMKKSRKVWRPQQLDNTVQQSNPLPVPLNMDNKEQPAEEKEKEPDLEGF